MQISHRQALAGMLLVSLPQCSAALLNGGGWTGSSCAARSQRLPCSRITMSVVPSPWVAYTDEDSGQVFYHNPESGDSVWTLAECTAPAPPPSPPPPPPPPPPPAAVASPLPTDTAQLKARLLTLVRKLPNRGLDAYEAELPPWEQESLLDLVDELEPLDPSERDGWMYSDFFDGEWRLRYTSSRTFHRNEGLTGYAYRNPNCETPELLLTRRRLLKATRAWPSACGRSGRMMP